MENQNHEYKLNFLATVYPEMGEEAFNRFCEDIKEKGLYNPITLHKGEIIDGRHRYLACKKLGIEPKFNILPDDKDPVNYVVSQNSHRRTLNKIEIALNYLELPRVAKGSNQYSKVEKEEGVFEKTPTELYTMNKIVEATGLQRNALTQLDKVRTDGTKELRQAVVNGLAIDNASKIALLSPEDQIKAIEIINTGNKEDIAKIYKQVNDKKHEAKINMKLAKKAAIVESLKHIPLIEQSQILGEFEKSYILGRSEDELKKLADNSIDLILTDPPYLQDYLNTRKKIHTLPTDGGIENDTLADLPTIKKVAEQCYRVLKPGRHLYWFGNIMYVEPQRQMLEDIGFSVKNILVWTKENHGLATGTSGFSYQYEIILYAVKEVKGVENREPQDIEGCRPSDWLNFKRVKDPLHGHQKPDEMLKHLIKLSSFEKEKVLDPFAGSGSTLIASLESGRYAIGFEMKEDIHKKSLEGWQIHFATKEQQELDLGEIQ